MTAVYVHGLGFWSAGFPNVERFCAGREEPEASRPDAALLEGPLKRRATPLTRLGVEVLGQAARHAGTELSSLSSVWATAHGEHSPAIDLLGMMHRGEGRLSPTKFHNSVHNTPSGYASIATGNRSVSTTLTGGPELVAATIIESIALLRANGGAVAAIMADEPLLPPFERKEVTSSLGVALVLAGERRGALAQLSMPRLEHTQGAADDPRFGTLHISAALPLVRALGDGATGTVPLQLRSTAAPDRPLWVADVESMGGSARSLSTRA